MKRPQTEKPELLRWLQMQGSADRRVLARLWGLPSETDPDAIAHALLDPERVRAQWQRLSEAERAALTRILQEDGALPVAIVQREWGPVREPSRFANPRAYLEALGAPASPLERLYMMGLLVREHDQRGPVFRVLNDLRALLPRVEPRDRTLHLAPVDQPPHWTAVDPVRIDQAVVALLELADDGILKALDDGSLNKASLVKLAARITPDADLRGMRREVEWPWVSLVRAAVVEAGLLRRTTDGLLRLAPAAKSWLQVSRAERIRMLLDGWIASAFNELTTLCALSLRSQPFDLRLPESRKSLLSLLASLPHGLWLPVREMLAEVQRVEPDFLRRNGRYDTWLIYNARGQLQAGRESWMQVEGVFVEAVVFGVLRWFGLIDGAGTERWEAFRLTPLAAYVLHNTPLEAEPTPEPLTVQGTFDVVCPPGASLWARFQLGRIAERVSDDAAALFRLTRRSVLQAVERGMTADEILRFLAEHGRGPVPQAVQSYIREWSGQVGQFRLEEAALLRSDDPLRLAELKRVRSVDLPPIEELTPTTWKVSSGDVSRLVQQLSRAGFSVDSAGVETRGLGGYSRKMSPSEHDLKALVTAAYAYTHICAELGLPCEVSSSMLMRLQRMVPSRHADAAHAAAQSLRDRVRANLDGAVEAADRAGEEDEQYA